MDCLAMVAMVIDHRKRAIKIKIFPRTTFRNASSSRRRRIFVAFSLFLPSGRANKIEPRKLVNDTKLGKKKKLHEPLKMERRKPVYQRWIPRQWIVFKKIFHKSCGYFFSCNEWRPDQKPKRWNDLNKFFFGSNSSFEVRKRWVYR